MSAKKVCTPPKISLQELFEQDSHISQRLLLEYKAAEETLVNARERAAIVRQEIEERLIDSQPIESGMLVVVRTGDRITVLERSELCEDQGIRATGALRDMRSLSRLPF